MPAGRARAVVCLSYPGHRPDERTLASTSLRTRAVLLPEVRIPVGDAACFVI